MREARRFGRPQEPLLNTPQSARTAQVFSAIGHFYIHLFTAIFFTIALGIEDDWGVSFQDLLPLWTLGAALVGAAALPAGWIADRWSARAMMVVFFIGIGGAAILCGLVEGSNGLVATLALVGLFAAIYHPVGIPWLVRNATARGKALGINGIFGNLGMAAAGITAGTLTALAGWRVAFIVPGAIALATGIVMLAMVRAGRVPEGGPAIARSHPPSRGHVLRAFFVMLMVMFCGGLVFHGTQSALPKLFQERLGYLLGEGTEGVGLAVGLVYAAAGLMQLIGGHLADRWPLKRLYVLAIVLQPLLLYLVAIAGGMPLIFAATLSVVVGIGILPAENLLLAYFAPDRHQSLAFGLKYVVAFGTGPIALFLVARLSDDGAGFYPVFALLAVLMAVAFLASLALPAPRIASAGPAPTRTAAAE
jgi:MFS family permease